MKRCPECRRDYYDDTLLYCLDDGNALLDGPSSGSSTLILADPPGIKDAPTKVFGSADLGSGRSKSIAVLPFVNMSADAENEYFCDGLAEEILNALAKISGLKVAARTSAFSFKGKDARVSRIGQELGVENILEGSVRRSGVRLRITVQLIDAINGFHLWSERYDRELVDIFDIQDDITISVLDALKLKLLSGEKNVVLKRHTDDPAAFENYLKGIYYRWKLEPEEFCKCGEYFQRAVEIDPDFALAYFGLASYYGYGTAWGMLPISPEVGWKKAESAIERMTELDPTLPEVLIGNAMKLVHYRQWSEAGKAIESAAAANPAFGEIHHLNSFYLLVARRFDEAISSAKLALTIDPISVNFRRFLGVCLHFAGRLDEAIEQYASALELDPKNSPLHEMLSGAYMQKGEFESAAAEMRAALVNQQDEELISVFDAAIAGADLHSAAATVANKKIERMKVAQAAGKFVLAIGFAREYMITGDVENAMAWLEKAADERNVFPLLFGSDPFYQPLRQDPRFAEILRRVGGPRN